MHIYIDGRIKSDIPDLKILATIIEGLGIKSDDQDLELLKSKVIEEVKSKHRVDSLKDIPSVRAYREFFWRIGIDPTKSRPAAEALIRRVVLNNPLPKINTFVDSLNLASLMSEIAIGSFDIDRVSGELIIIRYANKGEVFQGIGMSSPIVLKGCEVVLSDNMGPIAIYPHRDSERTKITESTRRALLVFCGVPGIDINMLLEAMNITVSLITRFCGGSIKPVEVE